MASPLPEEAEEPGKEIKKAGQKLRAKKADLHEESHGEKAEQEAGRAGHLGRAVGAEWIACY